MGGSQASRIVGTSNSENSNGKTINIHADICSS